MAATYEVPPMEDEVRTRAMHAEGAKTQLLLITTSQSLVADPGFPYPTSALGTWRRP